VYNLAHWDGSDWQYLAAEPTVGASQLYSIYYFHEDDIWVSGACLPIHWDGTTWTLYHLQEMGFDVCAGYGIWGTSSSNMYFVGSNGSIVHYDGTNFEQMESGTSITLLEIEGTEDGEHVIVSGYDYVGELSGQSIALELIDGTWNTLFYSDSYLGNITEGDYGRFASLDVIGDTAYLATSATDLIKYNLRTKAVDIMLKYRSPIYGRSNKFIKGISPNNLIFLSVDKEIIHYNGKTYHTDNILHTAFDGGFGTFSPLGMRYKDGVLCIVGDTQGGSLGIVVTGVQY